MKLKRIAFLAFAVAALAAVTSCERRSDAEKAYDREQESRQETLDRKVQEVKDAADRAAEMPERKDLSPDQKDVLDRK